jgi:cytochrome c biogenesis protein CcdA
VSQNMGEPGLNPQGYIKTPDNNAGQGDDIQGMKSSKQSHKMSIALIIGFTIGLIGLVILLYGLFGNINYSQSANINIDLWWGVVMVAFGIIMGGIGYISARRPVTH